VVHVHSYLGGHTSGQFAEIIDAARQNHLDFVVMTEHTEQHVDTALATLKGKHEGVLFVNGNEVGTANADRVLAIPGDASLSNPNISVNDVAARLGDGFLVAAYPDEFKEWNSKVDGIEIYNVFTNSKLINPVVGLFDTLWLHGSYPSLMFANYYQRPTKAIRTWETNLANRKQIAIAGNDSHSNVGIQLTRHGQPVFRFQVDQYEASFQLVRMHLLLSAEKELNLPNIIDSLKSGRCFIGFDLMGDTTGFRFEAFDSTTASTWQMGDEVGLSPNLKFRLSAPLPARIVLFKNGAVIFDQNQITDWEIQVSERGVYRVEVYQPQLGKPFSEHPWIISNPIFVR
jgi:hypothetical protein